MATSINSTMLTQQLLQNYLVPNAYQSSAKDESLYAQLSALNESIFTKPEPVVREMAQPSVMNQGLYADPIAQSNEQMIKELLALISSPIFQKKEPEPVKKDKSEVMADKIEKFLKKKAQDERFKFFGPH